jgi:erythrocyte band 7 integral membrane protein
MYYKVRYATSTVANVDDYCGSARLLAANTLRNVLGTKGLGDILSERESIAHEKQELLHEATEPWGVSVERVEVKDVRVPEQLMRAMAAEAEAARNARAKVIATEGEQQASSALKHAAEIIMENPAALQVDNTIMNRKSVNPSSIVEVSAENNGTIIFPLPVDILSSILTRGNKY